MTSAEDRELLFQGMIDTFRDQATRALNDEIRFARKLLQEVDSPIDLLKKYPWSKWIDNVYRTPDQIRDLSICFDLRSPFSRIVLAVLLVERYFPTHPVYVAEVLKNDYVLMILQDNLDNLINYGHKENHEVAKNILMLEESQVIVVVDDQQFDPTYSVLGVHATHPNTRIHGNPWSALQAMRMVDFALEQSTIASCQKYFDTADIFCGNLFLSGIKRAMFCGSFKPDIQTLEMYSKEHLNARFFYWLWIEFNDISINKIYPREVFLLLDEEYSLSLEKQEEEKRTLHNGTFRIA